MHCYAFEIRVLHSTAKASDFAQMPFVLQLCV
jgi:hypothetical protein